MALTLVTPSVRSFAQTTVTDLDPIRVAIDASTGEKPQSKVWRHAGTWWTVLPSTDVSPFGTWLWRLEPDHTWTNDVLLSPQTTNKVDVKVRGDVAHVLLHSGSAELVSIEFDEGTDGYDFWSVRPTATEIALSSSETASIDIDTFGRMWLATESRSDVEVYYADPPYANFTGPVVLYDDIGSDDIAAVTALPNGTIGVLWSNQKSERFGFRTHPDGTDAGEGFWSADEVPAAQSALNVGKGMADDHLNLAVTSDGTLYAAVKTSYDTSGETKIGLLVRRPGGTWDDLYEVDTSGTRGIAVVNEDEGSVLVIYSRDTGGDDIVFRASPLSLIDFGSRQTLISGSWNNVTSTKAAWTDQLVVLASDSNDAAGVLLERPTSLIAHWTMEEGGGSQLVDAGAYANDGTLSGNPAWMAGVDGLGLHLDGAGDLATVPDDASLDIEGPITLSAWVKPRVQATQQIIRKSSATAGYALFLSSTGAVSAVFNGNPSLRVDSTTTYPTTGDDWMHVAVTYDLADIRLYIDGVEQESLGSAFSIGTSSQHLSIGGAATGAEAFTGVLDDLRIYDRALSAPEIQSLASIIRPLGGLVGHWKMDEGGGPSLIDSSGHANVGTVYGDASWVAGSDGLALELDGNGDFARVADDGTLDVTDALTVSACVKPGVVAAQDIVTKAEIGAVDGYGLSLTSLFSATPQRAVFALNEATWGDTFSLATDAEYVADGTTWTHLAGTYDGTTIRIFRDGVEAASAIPGPGGIAPNGLPLGIGAEVDAQDGASREFLGQLDDVRVYSTALPGSEIANLAVLCLVSNPVTTSTSTSSTSSTSTSSTSSASTSTTTTTLREGTQLLEVRVAAASDDAEESLVSGTIDLGSSDLEMPIDGAAQAVGMRFVDIQMFPGAKIERAYVQFSVDESSSSTTSLLLTGEAIGDAAAFSSNAADISGRARTSAVVWSNVPPWPSVNAAGPEQRTADIASIVQEIVSRPDWVSGNALAIIVEEAAGGSRVARSYDGTPSSAPMLHLEFTCEDGVSCATGRAGACASGMISCQGGAPVCIPMAPALRDETCDGVDDDCDGSTDEDYVGPSTTCGLGLCAGNTGTLACVDGALQDTCDPLGGAAADDAICDGLDEDCDGVLDEDHVAQATSCGVGACRAVGLRACEAGQVVGTCVPGSPASNDPTCDGVDDDCDGVADEDYVAPPTVCGVGVCAGNTGALACVNGAPLDTCDPLDGAASTDTTCDGVDEDCDGAADEDYVELPTTCGEGACAGSAGLQVCINGQTHDTCDPRAGAASNDPTCDGVDDDCDGVADEDYVAPPTVCGVGVCAGNTGVLECVNGLPEDTCDPLAGAAPDDSICDGVDEDCDGALDEDVVCAPGTVCDPTTGRCENSEIIGTIVQDAYTRASDPGTNFNDDELHADASSAKHIFLHVGVTGIGGRVVEQALLRMTVASGSSAGSDHGGSVHVVPCDWDEDLITWANEPVIDPAIVDDHPQSVTSGQVVAFDLSGTITGDGQYCYAVTIPSSNLLRYVSSQSIDGPVLEITAATPTTTTIGPTTTLAPATTTLASTTTTLVSTTTTTSGSPSTTSTPSTTTSSSTTTTSLPTVTAVNIRVAASSHDAEEELGSGDVDVGSSDLEMTVDHVTQVVGIRFADVMIPRNAGIARAYVQFTVDNETTEPTTLAIWGEATDDALPYEESAQNISSRSPTVSTVPWINVPGWPQQGESDLNQRTPDIASIIQEIVARSGWVEGNALAISITGTGSRVADSYDGDPATAPMLHVEYFESGVTTSMNGSTTSTSSTTTTTMLAPSAEATAVVVADAYTRASNAGRNYNDDELTADERSAKRSYLRISVSDVGGRTVQQALLRMTVGSGGAASADGGELHATTCTWEENAITWDTQPAIDTIVIDAHPQAVAEGEEVVFDLTRAIDGDGTHCFALTSPSSDRVGYRSSETAEPPVVEILVRP